MVQQCFLSQILGVCWDPVSRRPFDLTWIIVLHNQGLETPSVTRRLDTPADYCKRSCRQQCTLFVGENRRVDVSLINSHTNRSFSPAFRQIPALWQRCSTNTVIICTTSTQSVCVWGFICFSCLFLLLPLVSVCEVEMQYICVHSIYSIELSQSRRITVRH